jgi:DNA-binding CsgD family transcriptional regulator/tetratricopeptide (TPR) repeat protein
VPANTLIVGRNLELALLQEALGDPACGGVALVGPAGVGKTLLARHAGELAEGLGLPTTVVRATSSASAVPFAALEPFLDRLGVPPEGDRNVFRAAAAALKTAGDERIVVVVDDAHELDDASAALLDQLVDAGSIFVVLTVRLGDPSGAAAVDMWKDLHVRRVQIDPLADEDICEIAENVLQGPVDAASMRQLVRASAGNVLFLRELIEGARETGTLRRQFGLWRLEGSLAESARLRDLIEVRLSGLGEEERTALELVAIGEPLPISVLAPLVPLDAVEQLELRHLVESHGDRPDPHLRLAHPLYGEVVRATLPAVRRARLSQVLADTLEGHGELSGPALLRVAVWRLDGGGGTAEVFVAACRAAFRSEDYVLAERLGRAGWNGWHRADAGLLLGETLDVLGRSAEADGILEAAARVATNDQELTSIAVRRASLLFRSLDRPDEAERVVAEATAAVHDPACWRELLALQGDHLLLAGDVAGAMEVDRPLLDGPSDAAFAQASLDVGTALVLAGRTAEAIAHTTAALSARLDLDDELQLSRTGVYVVANALALAGAGRLHEASALAEAAYEVAVERRIPDGQAWLASVLGTIRLDQGRLRSAINLFREVVVLFGELKHPGKRWGLGGIALAAGQMADAETSAQAVTELDDIPLPSVRIMDVRILRGRAWSDLAHGDLPAARTNLWRAHELAEQWGQYAGAADALFDLVRMGDRDAAVTRLIALEPSVDGNLMAARVALGRAVAARDLHLAEEASARFEAAGALLCAAEAATLAQRLAAGEGLQRRAAALVARTSELLGACEGARTPGLSRGVEADPLTSREREVALLAARGLTSREIAERLFVSKRTVDNQLQRVYTKLGVSGRAELPDRLDGPADATSS